MSFAHCLSDYIDAQSVMRAKEQRRPLVKRRTTVLNAESSRVITRPHIPGDSARIKQLVTRVLKLSADDVHHLLEDVFHEFSARHRNFRQALERNFEHISGRVPRGLTLTAEQRLLLGAYVTCEYSVEAAALFNPSIVPHPDQKGVDKGSLRFVMSFRGTGEGHVSSIEFRSGTTPEMHTDPVYHRLHFRRKLEELGARDRVMNHLLEGLRETFTLDELETQIRDLRSTKYRLKDKQHAIDTALWLARSNYEVIFRPDQPISERVLFPVSANESAGIEDARFVRFVDDDGSVTYYATYTAYNGFVILPQLLETYDFLTFKIHTLSGNAVQNKGMALFPRKINGRFVMLSRQDGVNNYIMFSDSLRFWNDPDLLQEPLHPLEFVQVGNCGSPVETSEGWLALFHGVGPMRRYSIWAELLDIDDPSKVISRLDEPILTPDEHERDGYGIADQRCRVASLSIPEVLSRLRANRQS
jgi:predicted GH43/DUF377 family glycosyl hydrolase